MIHDAVSHHIEIDIHKASDEMRPGLYGSRMIPIPPECALAILSSVVFLSCFTADQLKAPWNHLLFTILDQQVDRVGGDCVIEDLQSITLFRFEQPLQPSFTVTGKLEEKLFFVASVSDVPHLPWYMMTIRSGHQADSLKPTFSH